MTRERDWGIPCAARPVMSWRCHIPFQTCSKMLWHHCVQFFHSIFGSLPLITCLSALIILRNKPSSVINHFLREVRYWHILVKYQCLIFQVFIGRFLSGHGMLIKTWKIPCPWMCRPIATEKLENSFPEEVIRLHKREMNQKVTGWLTTASQ